MSCDSAQGGFCNFKIDLTSVQSFDFYMKADCKNQDKDITLISPKITINIMEVEVEVLAIKVNSPPYFIIPIS